MTIARKYLRLARKENPEIRDALVGWFHHLVSDVTEESRLKYLSCINQLLDYKAENGILLFSILELSRGPFLPDYFSYLKIKYGSKERQGRVTSSYYSSYSAVKNFLRFCELKGFISSNNLHLISKPKRIEAVPTKGLTRRDSRRLFESLRDKYQKSVEAKHFSRRTHLMRLVLYLIFIDTGARKRSILNIRVKDVFRSDDHLSVELLDKGGKRKTIKLNTQTSKYLGLFIKAYRSVGKAEHYLFTQRNSKTPLGEEYIKNLLQRELKELGINEKITAHSLRVSAANCWNLPLRDISKRLGHASIMTTEKYLRDYDSVSDNERIVELF